MQDKYAGDIGDYGKIHLLQCVEKTKLIFIVKKLLNLVILKNKYQVKENFIYGCNGY